MSELPEVETVRRGLIPHLLGQRFSGAIVRDPRLRWPVPSDLDARLAGRLIERLERRGKYLILRLDSGNLILHLSMSGSVRLVTATVQPARHDHLDLILENGAVLRYHDPRRFGAVLLSDEPEADPLLAPLGIEPLEPGFDGDWLYAASRGRKIEPAPLRAPGRRRPEHPGTGHRGWRQHAARLCRQSWQTRLFPTNLLCLWPGRAALPGLRRRHTAEPTWQSRHVFLPEMPEKMMQTVLAKAFYARFQKKSGVTP